MLPFFSALRGDGRGLKDGEDFIKPPNAADRSKTHHKLSRSMSLKYL